MNDDGKFELVQSLIAHAEQLIEEASFVASSITGLRKRKLAIEIVECVNSNLDEEGDEVLHTMNPTKVVDGYYLPNAGERAVYFKDSNLTSVFPSQSFSASPFEDDDNAEILYPT